MGKSHNKKRNVGLLYEFLLTQFVEDLINKNESSANQAIKIIKKHIAKKDSELFKEFKLFNALVNSTVDNKSIARNILQEAKSACLTYDKDKLDKEKSLLIRSINHTFGGGNFYNKKFDNYKIYATVQTLFNEWRQDTHRDIVKIAKFEDEILNWLTSKKETNFLQESKDDVDDVLLIMMSKKANEKYKNILCKEQINLINEYVTAKSTKDYGKLKKLLEKVRLDTLGAIKDYESKKSNLSESVLEDKFTVVKEMISGEVKNFSDEDLNKFLSFINLKNALEEKNA